MKPYLLTIEGLFSFYEKQTIDFESLTGGGIFGIFGPTGAGKSSILESMIFALYGRSDKGKNNQIVNIKSKTAAVSFVFSMLIEGVRRKFEIIRVLKVKKDGTAEQSAVLSEILIDGKKALCEGASGVDNKVEEIIGLKLDDFKKCIVLPQGEFAKFIEAPHRERSSIMGRLFSLDELGDRLIQKLNAHIDVIEGKKDNLEGQLKVFEGITKEKKDLLIKDEKAFAEELKVLKIKFIELEKLKKEQETAFEKFKKLETYKNELKVLNEQDIKIEEKKRSLQLYKKAVEIYPKIEKTEDLYKRENETNSLNTENEKKLNIAKDLFKIFNETYFDIKTNLEKEKTDTDIKLSKISGLLDEQKKFTGYEAKIKGLRKDYSDYSCKIIEDKKTCLKFESYIETTEKSILDLTEKIKDTDLKFSKLYLEKENEILKAQNKVFKETENEFNKNLYSAENKFIGVSACFKGFKDYLKAGLTRTAIINDNVPVPLKQTDINALTEEKNKLQADRELLEKKVKELNSNLSNLKSQISKNEETLVSIEKEGKSTGELIEQLKKIFSNAGVGLETDIIKYSDELKSKSEKILAKLADLELEKERINSDVQNYKNEFIQSKEKLNSLKAQVQESDNENSVYIMQAGFKDILEVKTYYNKKAIALSLENEINEFDNTVSELNINIKTLMNEIKGKNIDEKEFFKLIEEHKRVNEKIKKLTEDKAVADEQLKKYKEDEILKKSIEKNLSKVLKDYETADRLKKAVKNKALMDFAVLEYFIDITKAASEKLLFLSNGEFELKYNDNSFFVKDNLNGGELREVCTLSGGEIFLVSLALAVSLSEAIVSLSSRPIEFFFLDEGFGTLDSNSIDIVMTALEKLTKTHFAIGLISHVPELKQRITNKLNLEKQNGISKIV